MWGGPDVDRTFLAGILAILEKLDHPDLHEIFREMLVKAPSKNEKQLESKYPLYRKQLEESIKNIPGKTLGMKPGIEALSERVFWKDGARCHPIRGTIRGYSFAEIIAGYGGDGLYHHDKFRLGFYVQAPGVDYPAHAHDAEEWYLILSGSAKWHINDEIYQAEAGRVFHHPPGAAHRMTTTDQPFFALWMRTGALFGRYWFIGHEEIPQAGEQQGDGRGLWT